LLVFSCSLEEEIEPFGGQPPVPIRTGCDELDPTIFIHGALAASDIWAIQWQRFAQNDICQPQFFFYDWNASGSVSGTKQLRLDRYIDQVLQQTRSDKVNLVAHSSGGWLAYQYLRFPEWAQKVRYYAHIGSVQFDTLPGPPRLKIPTVNIWSPDNRYFSRIGEIPEASNVYLLGKDHHQIATSRESFRAIYEHLSGGLPPRQDQPAQEVEITLSGKALQIGGNKPEAGATIYLYRLEPGTGHRRGNPIDTFQVDEEGHWGPVNVKAETYYEFFLRPADPSARPVHFYREPFRTSNPLVYLRTPPGWDHPTQLFFSILPKDDRQSVVGVFSASQIVIDQRDNLLADGFDLANPDLAAREETTNAFLVFDDGDGQTSGNPYDLYDITPFFSGVDLFLPGDRSRFTRLKFNGRNLVVPNWRSETDGLVFAIFD